MGKGGPAGLCKVCQHSIKELLMAECCVGPSSLSLPLERGEVPSLLHRAPKERGGEALASLGLLCHHDVRSLSEATEGGPWGLEVVVGSV